MNVSIHRLLTIVLLLVGPTVNASSVNQVVDINLKKTKEAATSQNKVDKSFDRSNRLLEEYRSTNQQNDGLQLYSDQLTQQIERQQVILSELDYSISQVTVIERQLPALIQKMMLGLTQFVTLDAPFHRQERQQRIEHINQNLKRADLSFAEKFRQVLEAYKIETEYGRKIDSYEDTIDINGLSRKVNILRVGRIALLYQSKDRKLSGLWDRESRQWEALDNDEYSAAIIRGIKVAKKQSTIELLQLPITSAETVR